VDIALHLTLNTTVTILSCTTTADGVLIATWFIIWYHVITTRVRVIGEHLCVRGRVLVFTYIWMKNSHDAKRTRAAELSSFNAK